MIFKKAINYADKMIKQNPNVIDGYIVRSLAYEFTDEIDKEIKDYNKIIEIRTSEGKSSDKIYYKRYKAWMHLEQFEEALTDIDYLINNIDRNDSIFNWGEMYLDKGSILNMLDKQKEALHFYNLAEKENTSNSPDFAANILVGKAKVEADKKNISTSIKLLNRAIEIDSQNGIAYGARGVIYFEQGNTDGAFRDFYKAKKYDPNNSDIYFNIGQLYANDSKNIDSATYYFDKAIKLAPQSPVKYMIHTSLGDLNHDNGKLNEALEHFKIAERLNSKNDLFLFNYSMLLSDMGKNTEALEKINRAIINNPRDPEYFNLKGLILNDQSDFNNAEKTFIKAIEINPNYGGAYYNLGYINSKKENIREAIKYYNKAVALNFDLPATLVNRALLKFKINQSDEACSDLNRAFQLGRTDIEPLIAKQCKLNISFLCEYKTEYLVSKEYLDYASSQGYDSLEGVILDYGKDYSNITITLSSVTDKILKEVGLNIGDNMKIYIDNKQNTIDNKTQNLCKTKLKDFIIKDRKIKFSISEAIMGGTVNHGIWHLTYAKAI